MLNRSFFSLQDNWVPTAVALGNLFLNAILDIAFAPFGIWGIPLATSFVNIAGTAALLVVMRRRLDRIEFGSIASSFVRVLVAAAVAGQSPTGSGSRSTRCSASRWAARCSPCCRRSSPRSWPISALARALHVREMHALLSLRSRFRSG